jgi:hypothetical protein
VDAHRRVGDALAVHLVDGAVQLSDCRHLSLYGNAKRNFVGAGIDVGDSAPQFLAGDREVCAVLARRCCEIDDRRRWVKQVKRMGFDMVVLMSKICLGAVDVCESGTHV